MYYVGIYISELFTDLWTIERIVPSLSWLTSHNSLWPYHCSLLITHCKHVSRGGVVSSCDFRDFPIELNFESRLSFWAVNNILRCNVFIFSQHLKPESFNKEPTDQRVSLMDTLQYEFIIIWINSTSTVNASIDNTSSVFFQYCRLSNLLHSQSSKSSVRLSVFPSIDIINLLLMKPFYFFIII